MSIVQMTDTDRVLFQSVTMQRKSYQVRWLPNAIHKNFLICFKSAYLEYPVFCELLKEHYQENTFESDVLYFIRSTKGSFIEVPMEKINRPVEIIILPIRENDLYLPKTEKEFDEMKYTCKGTINFKAELKKGKFFQNTNDLIMIFSVPNISLNEKEVIAEYVIDQNRYPVTVKMLDKTLEVQIKRSSEYHAQISKKYKNKYTIREDEL